MRTYLPRRLVLAVQGYGYVGNYRLVFSLLHIRAMDPGDVLTIRFHIGGRFDYDGFNVIYIGETYVGLSHFDRD